MQNLMVNQAFALDKSGLFDGIMLDWWNEDYVLFGDNNAIPAPDHLHNWYDFWDADLGKPIQDRAVQYRDATGLFIREFENGWAVYNRSGATRTVTFDNPVIQIGGDKHYTRYDIPDFDGEIFLKTGTN